MVKRNKLRNGRARGREKRAAERERERERERKAAEGSIGLKGTCVGSGGDAEEGGEQDASVTHCAQRAGGATAATKTRERWRRKKKAKAGERSG